MRLTAEIAASREEVFDLYTDPARRAEWNPAARQVAVEAGTLNEAGSRYVVETRYGRLYVEVLEVDRPRLYRLRERSGPMQSESTVRFEVLPHGRCRLTADVCFERDGLRARLLALVFEAGGRWWARGELRRLKAAAERRQAC